MNPRLSFYSEAISAWIPDHEASVLVVGGGSNDRDVFVNLGFHQVVISNLDTRMESNKFAPLEWSFQNAEHLTYPESSFDYVVVHAALHHCQSPHLALTEMYRVAKKAIIFIEARDSLIMRLIEKLHFTQTYESVAVYYNDGKFGGVGNTDVPNFVYRWNEREVEKTISTYEPYAKHTFSYRYGHDSPALAKREKRGKLKLQLLRVAIPCYEVVARILPKQQNLFAAKVDKPRIPEDLFPWVKLQNDKIVFNMDWANQHYKVDGLVESKKE